MTKQELQMLTETRDIVIRVEQKLKDHCDEADKNKRNGVSRWEATGQWASIFAALLLHFIRGHK